MLGEAARTAEDAARYFAAYSSAIRAVAPPDSLSVKLSALHPRFEEMKRARVFSELLPKLKNLAGIAATRGVGITIDAEESERLELTLDIFEALTGQFDAGLAVQAYQKRAAAVCDWLIALGRSRKRRIPMRLVKGAYWDSEIKRAQQLGMPDYPVFPRKAVTDIPYVPDPRIPLPRELYADRRNSLGLDLARRDVLDSLYQRIAVEKLSPAPPSITLDSAIGRAAQSFEAWSRVPAAERAAVLERAADLLEERRVDLVALIVREGGRTCADAVSEVREAADFCRYYASQTKPRFVVQLLPGPAGERNELQLHGRGVFACISPWNFPLSIFTGQVAAALAAGNTVIAKPAEQTPRIGFESVRIFRQAGVAEFAVQCVAGDGEVGASLVADPRIAGVAFTGSVETAKRIDLALAQRAGPIVPLIAETGGDNAMIVDSSALPEQVVDDVVVSAFQSAGQRCSAQRILFVDAGCAPRVLQLLAGALAELKVGDPAESDTDVGPIIDPPSRDALLRHIEKLRGSARLIGEAQLKIEGNYIAAVAFELALDQLPRTEVFGPILHVCLYRRSNLGEVLQWIRDTGYGLSLGIHSRIQSFVDEVVRAARVGNIYVNRSMIGAVVGVQPFGGEGLSGTGPKAGGPHYLPRFATERTLTVNTAAVGGVTELLTRT